jgi:hypothetical protein
MRAVVNSVASTYSQRNTGCVVFRSQPWADAPRPASAHYFAEISTLSDAPSRPKRRSPVTPEVREKYRAAAKARWADPVIGEKIRTALRDPANRARMRQQSIARWAGPATRETMLTRMRASNADPAVRLKKGALSKERWADPSMREKILAGMRTPKKRRKKRDISDH